MLKYGIMLLNMVLVQHPLKVAWDVVRDNTAVRIGLGLSYVMEIKLELLNHV